MQSYFTKNGTLAQFVSVLNNKFHFHVYFDDNLEIIGVEPHWYDVPHNNEASILLADVKVTEADIISYFKDKRVYGHILETCKGYEVQSWNRTYTAGKYQTLAEARLHLITDDAIASSDIDEVEFCKTSPFMEVLVKTPWGWI